MRPILSIAVLVCTVVSAQDINSSDPKQRIKAIREFGKGGSEQIARIAPSLKDSDQEVRSEAVRAISGIGTQHSLDPLIEATRDNDPEVQIRAADGLVNFYLPGYITSGLQRITGAVRSRFDRENTDIIDPYLTVRPEVITALGRVASGGASMESRANAARALGILRGKAAVPELIEALQTKDDAVLFESLIALQKIRDESAGPRVVFLLRDLKERVQIAAIETVGLLRTESAVPDLQRVYDGARSDKVRSAALTALSMVPHPSSRPYFERAFTDRNERVRAAAAEGFARLKNPADRDLVAKAFEEEKKMAPRLAQAFALVSLGNRETSELAPMTYLVNTLNSRSYRGIAQPYLQELARDAEVRSALAGYLRAGTSDEKIGLARVLAASGDKNSLEQIEWMMKDSDPAVAQEAIRAVRTLQARVH